ncbi:MAG: hypothetical protein FWG47_01190 [Propionibacteriaceae bacterium]|nr:hypothetical protein [Propionibacteriaceae bacterium]
MKLSTVLFTALVVLAGCTASPGSNTAPAGNSAWETWRPSVIIPSSNELSEAEKLTGRAEALALFAELYEIENPPDVPIIRWIKRDEWGPVTADCLTGQGFPSEYVDGGVQTKGGIADSQQQASNLASYICEAQYPVESHLSGPPVETYVALYEYYVDFYIPCAEPLGHQFPPPPTLEVFLATQNNKYPWQPWRDLDKAAIPKADWELLEATCPYLPPDDAILPS